MFDRQRDVTGVGHHKIAHRQNRIVIFERNRLSVLTKISAPKEIVDCNRRKSKRHTHDKFDSSANWTMNSFAGIANQ